MLYFVWKNFKKLLIKSITRSLVIIGKKPDNKIIESTIQFVKFGIVGVSNTVVAYILYTVSLIVMKRIHLFLRFDYIIAQIIAFVLSVLWSFYWNNKKVFITAEGQKRNLFKALIKTYIVYSFTGLFMNSFLLYIWINILNISEYLAPVLNIAFCIPVNFLLNKKWAFRVNK